MCLLVAGSKILQQEFLRFRVPQTVILLNQLGKGLKPGVGLTQGSEIINSRQRQIDMGVDQLLTAGDLGQIHGGIDGCVDAADVGDHHSGVDALLADHTHDVLHILNGTAAGAGHMMLLIVNIVEIEIGAEVLIQRAGKEIQTAVKGQNGIAQFNHGRYGGVHEHIVKAALCNRQQLLFLGGIGKHQLNAVFRCLLGGEDLPGPVQPLYAQVGDHHHGRLHFSVQRNVNGHKTHRAAAGQNGHLSAGAQAAVGLQVFVQMQAGLIASDDAGSGLNKAALEEAIAIELHQITVFHDVVIDDGIGGNTADLPEGIADGLRELETGKKSHRNRMR